MFPPAAPSSSARPRRAPRQARSAEMVAAILEAAARLLEEGGHAGFSTNAVARRAGVSIGSLYQCFPDKAALVSALIERETAALAAAATAAMAGGSSGQGALRTLVNVAVTYQLRRPALARLLDFEEARLPSPSVTGLEDAARPGTQRLRADLVRVLGRADLPAQADATLAAADLFAVIRALVDAAGERGETDPAPLRARVERAVFGYLGVG